MVDIIPPCDEKAKQEILTAQNFYEQQHVGKLQKSTKEWLEFAEAYAQERVRKFSIALNAKEVVIRRAAELLRPGKDWDGEEWHKLRDEWWKDAGFNT